MFRLFSYATPGDGKYYVLGVVSGGLTGIGKVRARARVRWTLTLPLPLPYPYP